jgi:hypothetical protein
MLFLLLDTALILNYRWEARLKKSEDQWSTQILQFVPPLQTPKSYSCTGKSLESSETRGYILWGKGRVKADSHIPCRSAKALDCLSHLIYTVRPCLIHTHHAVPMPWICLSESDLSSPRQGRGRVTAWEQHGMCELASAVQSFRSLAATMRSSRKFIRSIHIWCRWPVWNKATFVMDEEKLIIMAQRHDCLHNLQHKD